MSGANDGRRDRRDSEEAALLVEVADGDHGALAELYRRYEGQLYGFGRYRLGDDGLAEELVQETFMRLWRAAGRYDARIGSVHTYVFSIARNVATDLRRRPSSRPHEPAPDPEDGTLVSEDGVDRLIRRLVLRDALDSLTPAHRTVISLAHYEGLTTSQIAKQLGIPPGTVKTRMFHGLRALKLALGERGVDG